MFWRPHLLINQRVTVGWVIFPERGTGKYQGMVAGTKEHRLSEQPAAGLAVPAMTGFDKTSRLKDFPVGSAAIAVHAFACKTFARAIRSRNF